jgi:hypothetical protein
MINGRDDIVFESALSPLAEKDIVGRRLFLATYPPRQIIPSSPAIHGKRGSLTSSHSALWNATQRNATANRCDHAFGHE